MDTSPKEKIKKKYEKTAMYCCVSQCGSTIGSFHHFPKEPSLRKQWQDALKIGRKPSSYMRVCGNHFRPYDFFPGKKSRPRLKRNVIPSLNIPEKHSYQVNWKDTLQNEVPTRPSVVPNVSEHVHYKPEIIVPEVLEHIICKPEIVEPEKSRKIVCKPEPQDNFEQAKHETFSSRDRPIKKQRRDDVGSDPLQLREEDFQHPFTFKTDKNYHPEATEPDKYPFILTAPVVNEGTNEPMKPSTKDKAAGINILPIHLMVKTPEILLYYTGLRSFQLLNGIIQCVSDIEHKSPTNTKILSLKDRVLLVFITLKLNLNFGAVAPMFNISCYTCVRYFRMLVPLLAAVLESAVVCPTSEDLRINLPIAFNNYTDSRVVTDCVKTPVEKSKCLKCKILTYSHNKKDHAIKFKLGISPCGLITSITQCYQGKLSNKFITLQSHVLDKLDLQDKDLVDRGFFIKNDCLERNIILYQPPFVTKTPITSRKVKNSKTQMHAERVIEKVREFEMLNSTITWHLLPYIESCLLIVCGIVNLGNPVLSFNNFS